MNVQTCNWILLTNALTELATLDHKIVYETSLFLVNYNNIVRIAVGELPH